MTAQEEADTSKQGFHLPLSVRLAGIYSLEWLAKEDPEQYHIQIMQSFCSFATNPGESAALIRLRQTRRKGSHVCLQA